MHQPIEVNVEVLPEKYDLYAQADKLIAERLGLSPGPQALMTIILENEEDPTVLAELYCVAILHAVAA
jgi:hypothetical protein